MGRIRSDDYYGIEHVVLIIESPGKQDVASGRSEGEALRRALEISGIRCRVDEAQDAANLTRAFDQAAAWINEKPNGRPAIATVHIAAHGDENGIGLTSGERVDWATLRALLLRLADDTKRMNPRGLALIDLCMSSCCGAFAARMFDAGLPFPCMSIIGPTTPIEWGDTLTAFQVHYHQSIKRDVRSIDALPIAKAASGATMLAQVLAPNLPNLISEKAMRNNLEFEWNHRPELWQEPSSGPG